MLITALACSTEVPAPVSPTASTWLEVPQGTPVLEYDMVPQERRAHELELVAEMVIAERADDNRYAFGEGPPTLALDKAGRIFAYDASKYRVAVFSSQGEFLYQFGSRGEGPGEFEYDRRAPIGFLGDRLYIYFGYRRMGFWTPEGDFLGAYDHRIQESHVVPLDDGTVLASSTSALLPASLTGKTKGSGQAEYTVARFALTDAGMEPRQLYAAVPAGLRPNFAGTPSGVAYISTILRDTTQVVAFAPDAEVRWITRLRQPPGTPLMPADLLLDGRGRVHVVPRVNRSEPSAAPIVRTIDVLAGDGAHLAALTMPDGRIGILWQQARGDHIYGVQADPQTYEWQIARYRIVAGELDSPSPPSDARMHDCP